MRAVRNPRLAFLMGLLVTSTVEAQTVVELKSRAITLGPKIKLGEIAIVQCSNRDLKQRLEEFDVGTALPPGETKEISIHEIRLQLRRLGLPPDSLAVSGPTTVRVTTAHKDISKAIIEHEIADFIHRRFGREGVQFNLEFSSPMETIVLPNVPYQLRVLSSTLGRPRGPVPFFVEVIAGDRLLKRVSVPVNVRVVESVLVAQRALERGRIVAPEDLRLEERETTGLKVKAVCALDEIVGKRASRFIPAGRIIDTTMIEAVPDIHRGAVVNIIAVRGAVRVSAKGSAQEDGRVGQSITVKNHATGKRLTAEVVDSETVVIRL